MGPHRRGSDSKWTHAASLLILILLGYPPPLTNSLKRFQFPPSTNLTLKFVGSIAPDVARKNFADTFNLGTNVNQTVDPLTYVVRHNSMSTNLNRVPQTVTTSPSTSLSTFAPITDSNSGSTAHTNQEYVDDEHSILDIGLMTTPKLIEQTPIVYQIPTTQSPIQTLSYRPLLIFSIRFEIRSFDLLGILPNQNLHNNATEHTLIANRNSRTLMAGLKNTIGLDFLITEQDTYIFWTDVIEERIYKGKLIDGTISNVETIINSGLTTAEGLAVDWIGRNIYWVESTLNHIEVADIKGQFRRTLIAEDMESPRAIAVDPRYGYLFWTDWDKNNPRIERATMAGENRTVLVKIMEVKGGWPNGLTLDYDNLRIYWIDANSDSIYMVDYEGKNIQTLLWNFKSLSHPFSITLYENSLFWTDWKTNSVSMVDKRSVEARELQRYPSRLFDIKVVHPSRQPKLADELNPCLINKGNCSHLCLLSTSNHRRCECPPLMKLGDDEQTCQVDENVLLIGKTNEIKAVDIDRPLYLVMSPIGVPKVFVPKQFEFYAETRTIFWADPRLNQVKKAQLTGNNIETIMDIIIESPSGLALDWIAKNIYVTSAPHARSTGKIFVSNLNGEYISVLMGSAQGVYSPKSLVVDPVLGLMFCIDEDIHSSEPLIFVANMAGQNKRVIVNSTIDPLFSNPSNLAIDRQMNRVYWINQAMNISGNASIQFYDVVSDKIETIYDEALISPDLKMSPSVISVDGDYIYVNERRSTESIVRASKNNFSQRIYLDTQKNKDQFTALHVYNASLQRGINACSSNNGGCAHLCLPLDSTRRLCKCTMGFTYKPGSETDCVGEEKFLIFSSNMGIRGLYMDPSAPADDYPMPPIQKAFRATSIDYIYHDNQIFWVDDEEASIIAINRDTTDYKVIVQGLESEESIALDWIAGNMYILDPYFDTIEIARLNGSSRFVIVSGDMDKANEIVVNPLAGYIAWSDIGTIPKIEISRLDGSARRILVNTNISHVDDLAIDYIENYIYWVDSAQSQIERIDSNGNNRKIVYKVASSSNGQNHFVSIAIHENYLYAADSPHNQGSILRFDKNNASNIQEISQYDVNDMVRAITIFAPQTIPSHLENPCVKENGGCQDLCVFMGKYGQRRCICSHGRLHSNGLTCEPFDTFILYSKVNQIDSLHVNEEESSYNPPYAAISNEMRSNIIALAIDYKSKRILYSEISPDQICSVHFNGTGKRVLVDSVSTVEGIAFESDQLYWTSTPSISRLNTTSSGVLGRTCSGSICKNAQVEKLVTLTPEDKPRGIAVDTCTSFIYWTNWNAHASIQRAGPHDGYKIETIISTSIKVPNGITIDQSERQLYWCDAKLDKIESCNMDGTNRRILAPASPQHPFALAIWGNYVFWTDWISRGVFRADKYTGKDPVQLKSVKRPMGIVVAAPEQNRCQAMLPCELHNGNCPKGTVCTDYHNGRDIVTECRKISASHDVSLPKHHCSKHSRGGSCEGTSLHDIIMDVWDRYKVTDLLPVVETRMLTPSSQISNMQTKSNVTTAAATQSSTSADTDSMVTNQPASQGGNQTSMTPSIRPEDSHSSSEAPKQEQTTTSTTSATRTSTPEAVSSTSSNSTIQGFSTSTTTTTSEQPTLSGDISNQMSPAVTINTTISQPCQAALQPTTESNANHECKDITEFKCYLAERLLCIPATRRCDGVHDCPSKEDENDCYLSKRGPYNLKQETNWHRFVTVILIIFAAAVAALFLVFGARGRRRWFVGSSSGFGHRRMFDSDNGTNIEISNPMFEEDTTGNLMNCAFSIDLSERTTNFSNPLYERQVLLMSDKHMTPD